MGFISDSIDLNFHGSYINPKIVESEYELGYEPYFINLNHGFVDRLNISDLTDGNFEKLILL